MDVCSLRPFSQSAWLVKASDVGRSVGRVTVYESPSGGIILNGLAGLRARSFVVVPLVPGLDSGLTASRGRRVLKRCNRAPIPYFFILGR